MTPRVLPAIRRSSSFDEFRRNGEQADPLTRPFWDYLTKPALEEGLDPLETLSEPDRRRLEEYRVLSKAASGGGFLVPTDLAAQITSAARAASSVAQVANEIVTATGDTLNVSLGSTHGTAAWLAESGSYTPSDETITNQAMGAFKASTKNHRQRGTADRRSRLARRLSRR